MELTDDQVSQLARPLVDTILSFYEEPENEKRFQEWLKTRKGEIHEEAKN